METALGQIADILLAAGAFGAGLYCFVLSRRLRRFTDLEKGVGGAVAVLAVQVSDLEKSLEKAKSAAAESVGTLAEVNTKAETSAQRLELLIASLHDLSDAGVAPAKPTSKPDGPFFVSSQTAKAAAQ